MTLSAEQQRRIDVQLQLQAQVRAEYRDQTPPYFGHMRLATGLRELDVLLGVGSRTEGAVTLIDWRTAPLAEVFFTSDEGDDYELDLGDRIVSGKLLEKNLLTFRGEHLVRIEAPAWAVERSSPGASIGVPNGAPNGAPDSAFHTVPIRTAHLRPRPPSARRPFRSPLEVQLDPAQQRVVDLPADRSVLLLGEAGFGKTTVALHRLVTLRDKARKGWKACVIVPTEGLRRLTTLMLERRGAEDIEVFTYDGWAGMVARKVFRGLPKRESVNTTTQVMRLKRHPALRPILERYTRMRRQPARDEDRPATSRGLASRADLEHLFGDRTLMDAVIAESQGALLPGVAAQVTDHTKMQFSDTTERQYAHVTERDRLATADGRRIDEGTPMEDADSIDVEDYAVLFELDRLRSLHRQEEPATFPGYDCVLVDEAQEFAPLELRLIGRSLRPRGTVIVAGDAAQQVDPTSHFAGWQEVMDELGAPDAARAVLEVNYRCPPDVTALARSLIDPKRRPDSLEPAIIRAQLDNPFHLAVWLTRELRELLGQDPTASVAVIARSGESAQSYARALRHGAPLRVSLEGAFEFRPGLLVTCVPEVKGLEFDHIVIPDASAASYPDTRESRRALYVGVTRATHTLTLASAGIVTPLLSA